MTRTSVTQKEIERVSPYPYPPDYCSARTMAHCLDIAESTFLAHVQARTLPQGVKIGGNVRWNRQEVLAALDRLNHPERDASSSAMERAHAKATKARREAA